MIQLSTEYRGTSMIGKINQSVLSLSNKFSQERSTDPRSSTTSTITTDGAMEQSTVLSGATITAKAYSIFQRLRLLDNINYQSIFKSLDPNKNRSQIFSSGEASGASGSFFFFSHDKRFIVKTVSNAEMKLIEDILPDFYTHFKENPDSLLARIYGVYSVNMKGYAPVNLILMQNTLKFKHKDEIYRIYDLKGSRAARKVDTSKLKPTTTLKDINFF